MYAYVTPPADTIESYNRSGDGTPFSVDFSWHAYNLDMYNIPVVWRVGESSHAGNTAKDQIWQQMINQVGRKIGAPTLVTERNWSQIGTDVRTVKLYEGKYVVLWKGKTPLSGGIDDSGLVGICARIFDRTGAPISSEFLVTNESVQDGPLFSGVRLSTSRFAVVWSDGTNVRATYVNIADQTVGTPFTFNTPTSPPTHVTAARGGSDFYPRILVGWSYIDGGNSRAFVQQLDSTGTGYPSWSLTPYEIGVATAGNSGIWFTERSFGDSLYVTRGWSTSHRSYILTPSYQFNANNSISTGAIWAESFTIDRPPAYWPSGSVSAQLVVMRVTTTDASGTPWPNGAQRVHIYQVTFNTGAMRARWDFDLPAAYESTKGVAICTENPGGFIFPFIGAAAGTVYGSPTEYQVIGYVNPEYTIEADIGGPQTNSLPITMANSTEISSYVSVFETVPLYGHPTAKGIFYWSATYNSVYTTKAVLLDENGTPIGSPVTLFTNLQNARIVSNNTGGAVVVANESSGSGTLPSTIKILDQNLSETASVSGISAWSTPQHIVLSNGNIVVPYLNSFGLYVNIYSGTDLSVVASAVEIDPGVSPGPAPGSRTSYNCSRSAQLTPLTGGGFAAAWIRQYDTNFDNRWYRLYYNVFNNLGVPIGASKLGAPFPAAGLQYKDAIGSISNGGFYIIADNIQRTGTWRIINFDSVGNEQAAFDGLIESSNIPPLMRLPDGRFVYSVKSTNSSQIIVTAYDTQLRQQGTSSPVFHFITVDDMVTSGNFDWRYGLLSNGKMTFSYTYQAFNNLDTFYGLVIQTIIPEGNPDINSVNGLLEYDSTPTVPNSSGSMTPQRIYPRSADGSGFLVGYGSGYGGWEYIMEPLNKCAELSTSTSISFDYTDHEISSSSFGGLLNGGIVAAGGKYEMTTPEDYNGYFWRWTVDENTQTWAAAQTAVLFHSATGLTDQVQEAKVFPLSNGFVIAWVNYARSTDAWNTPDVTKPIISMRIYDNSGSPLGPAIVIDDRTDTSTDLRIWCGPAYANYGPGFLVKQFSNGNIAVVWDVIDWNDWNFASTWLRIYSSTGVAITGPIAIHKGFDFLETGTSNAEQLVTMEILDSGNLRILFRDYGQDNYTYDANLLSSYVGLRRDYDSTGNPIGTATQTFLQPQGVFQESNSIRVDAASFPTLLKDGSMASTYDITNYLGSGKRTGVFYRWDETGYQRLGSPLILENKYPGYNNTNTTTLNNGAFGIFYYNGSNVNLGVQFYAVDGAEIPICGSGPGPVILFRGRGFIISSFPR